MAHRPTNAAAVHALMTQAVDRHQRGDLMEAESLYRNILRQAPDLPDAHNFLGMLAHQTGRQDLADSHMRRSIELAPRRPELHYNYGGALSGSGRHQEAAREFQAAVDLAPDMTDAWQGLGMAMRGMGLEMRAIACFQTALKQDPRRVEVWLVLGECFQDQGLLPEAMDAYRKGQRLAPADIRFQSALTAIAVDSNDNAAAEVALDRLLSMAPATPEIHYQRGVWLANKGDFDAARSALEKALELAPNFYQAALYYAYITRLSVDSPLVTRLKQAAAHGQWEEPGRGANVHFTLGYVLDGQAEYDTAFDHYLEANRLQRQLHHYSTASHVEFQRAVLDAFSPAFMERIRGFANPSTKPLFIVGMPRSGTSLLEQMLTRHPEIYGGGEMTVLHAELRRRLGPASQSDYVNGVLSLSGEDLAAVAACVVAEMERIAPDARQVTDKLPSNATVLGLVHALFPNARIIHCQRDALDTCVSCFTTSFRQGHKFSNNLTELGEYHGIYSSTMARWKELLPPGILRELRYEELVSDMEPQLRALLAHCGLEWDPVCVDFQHNSRAVNTASVYQVRQPIYTSSIGRWRRYQRHLGPLQEALASSPLL